MEAGQRGRRGTLAVASARVMATSLVPLANFSNSNTPIGPFQMIVLQSDSSCDRGPSVSGAAIKKTNGDAPAFRGRAPRKRTRLAG